MSFLVTAFGLTGMAATLTAGAVYGGLTTVGMNLIRGNDPFDNIGQGILMGGITGGIFGGAGGAAAGEGAINAGGLDGAMGDSVSAYNTNMGVNSGNAAVNTIANTANPIAGMPSNKFGFDNQFATSQSIPPESYWSQTASGTQVPSDATPPQAGQITGTETMADPNRYGLQPPKGSDFAKSSQGLSGGPEYVAPQTVDYLNSQPTFNKINNLYTPPSATASTASPKFSEDMLGYLTHKDNRLQVAAGGLGLAGAMGAFNRNTGLKNLPPRAYQRVNTSYNPGTVNPKYGMPGEPYFVGQGYGPETRETFYGAAGGGIRALSGGGETYVPMTARGQMTIKENVPDDLDDSALNKKNSKYDINKKEKIGQAEIDKNVSSWLERYAKADVKGMAEGGPAQQVTQFQPTFSPAQQGIGSLQPYQAPNVPAMESSPTDYNQSPQYAPTQQYGAPSTSYSAPAANPMTAGLGSYLEGLKYKAPPVAPSPTTAPVYDSNDDEIYDPITQTYITNPNYIAPVVTTAPNGDGDGGGGGEKAGGPIASKRYAMGGFAALPEYAAGGELLSGDGDGMSDSIPAVIKGARPQRAALADGEFVIPADVVSHLGNGSTKAGGKRLYEMMANIRKARTGNPKQGKQINPMKFIPA